MTNFGVFDLLAIGGYFLVLLAISVWAARREKNVSADFFLASRDVGWLAVGASLFASNIGSEHLVGLAGTGGVERAGGRTLRVARLLDPAVAGLAVRAVLSAQRRRHHARVPRTPLQLRVARRISRGFRSSATC